jgi:PAS domain S-box-containing protein
MRQPSESPVIAQPQLDEHGFAPLLELLPDGVVIVDDGGRIVAANGRAADVFGYDDGELLGVELETLLPGSAHAARSNHRADIGRAPRARGMGVQLELTAIRKDGSDVPVDVSLGPFRSREGSFVLATVRDVTARRLSQERSAASEALLAEAQKVTHLGSWDWRIDTDDLTWSQELYRIFGLDPSSVTLSRDVFLERVHPDDRARVEAAIAHSSATGADSAMEYRIMLPDGRVRWLRTHRAVEFDGPRPVRMFGTALDVTEQKEVEQRLRDAETRYRTLLEQLPLAFYIRPLSLAEPNIYVSPQVETMLGFQAREWLTNPELLEQIVHPDDREKVLGDASRVRKTGVPLREEYRYITADGRVVWTLDETYLVANEAGEPYAVQGFLLDITERKEAEAERDRLLAELYHAQRLEALGRLAGGVAHDFNNMLTAIEGYSDLLLERLEPGSPLRVDAEEIRRAAGRASSLTRHLLAFSRRQTLEPQLVDLNEVVSGATNLLERLIGETIHLRAIPGATEPFLLADPAQVEQVLLNLVLNARDAMPADGTLTIETENVALSPRSTVSSQAPTWLSASPTRARGWTRIRASGSSTRSSRPRTRARAPGSGSRRCTERCARAEGSSASTAPRDEGRASRSSFPQPGGARRTRRATDWIRRPNGATRQRSSSSRTRRSSGASSSPRSPARATPCSQHRTAPRRSRCARRRAERSRSSSRTS